MYVGLLFSDTANFNVSVNNQLINCDRIHRAWLSVVKQMPCTDEKISQPDNCSFIFPQIDTAVRWLANNKDRDIAEPELGGPIVPAKMAQRQHVQVLVTGSLHLVGGFLKYLGPKFYNAFSD